MDKVRDRLDELVRFLTANPFELNLTEDGDIIKVTITVSPQDSGVLIGYHGEKIDALQMIVSLMVNQNALLYRPVEVDINGYREKRKQSIEDLAEKAALKAEESQREILLPPMPSHERRLIHMYLSERQTVSTYSEGQGISRRVVVRPEAE